MVLPQVPLDEIGILLYEQMYKIHVCVILEGKYWCTYQDEALSRAKIYMIYKGHMQFNDTTRKGSLHSGMLEEVAGGSYQLQTHGPIDEEKDAPLGRTTLNSMCEGLKDQKQLDKVQHEFDKMYKPAPVPKPKNPMGQISQKGNPL